VALIIHAPGIHLGGGRSLLLPLIEASRHHETTLVLDERLHIPASVDVQGHTIHRVAPRLSARFSAERLLRRVTRPEDVVLCMSNLQPLFRLPARVVVFIQNRYLVDRSRTLRGLALRARVRIGLERLWVRLLRARAHVYIVQSESMREAVRTALGISALVQPFIPQGGTVRRRAPERNAPTAYDFLYVASGEPHKNHRRLVEAWVNLARKGLRPRLCLTIDREAHPELCHWIEQECAGFGLRISNLGRLTPEDVLRLYPESGALIYPSDLESFGLPLIEARLAGLPILAAELDYVRDLIDPEESFDPRSPISIARAVERHLHASSDVREFPNAEQFLNAVLKRE